MKRSELQFNPFAGSEEFLGKKPEEMSADELKMLLHIKRLNIKLDVERLRTNINYYKIFIETAKELGLVEKFESWLSNFLNSDKEQSTENPKQNNTTKDEKQND